MCREKWCNYLNTCIYSPASVHSMCNQLLNALVLYLHQSEVKHRVAFLCSLSSDRSDLFDIRTYSSTKLRRGRGRGKNGLSNTDQELSTTSTETAMYFAPCGLTNLPFPLLPLLLAVLAQDLSFCINLTTDYQGIIRR